MRPRDGLTLIEVVVAMLVFSVGGLGLAASAAAIARQIAASTIRSDAALIARSRAERASAASCDRQAGGEATAAGVRSLWTTGDAHVVTLDQRLEWSDSFGIHSDRFLSVVPCE
ncbi:MAG: type IV pilus modification PilV family protein [Gemmatimonadaceae bacterium]